MRNFDRPGFSQRKTHRGFTLIEALITIALMAILAAIAVPSMNGFIQRKRVEGAVDQLMVDLRYAKSQQAIKKDVSVRFQQDATQTCYVIFDYDPAGCSCLSSPPCADASVVAYRTVSFPVADGLTVAPFAGLSHVRLYGEIGTPIRPYSLNRSPIQLSIKVASPAGGEARVTTNDAFLPKACSFSGHSSAYPPC